MNYNHIDCVGKMTVAELKNLIMECLRQFEEEKYRSTNAGAEEQYKQLWIKPPIITDEGFKCDG